MLIYSTRHFIFILNRSIGEQRLYYQDIVDSDLPLVSVVVHFHDDDIIANRFLEAIVKSDYPVEKLEIIAVFNEAEYKTLKIVERFTFLYPHIIPYKFSNVNQVHSAIETEILQFAKGQVIVAFEQDYISPKVLIRNIAISFKDPEVGAVLGRLIPVNASSNLLTRLIDLEQAGSYQIDQQARYNLKLIPQFSRAIIGFRKDVALELSDSISGVVDLTINLYTCGWKILYGNRVECYEVAPENWDIRAQQIMYWAHKNCQAFFHNSIPIIKSNYISYNEKFDGILLLAKYFVPLLVEIGFVAFLILFFLGKISLLSTVLVFVILAFYTALGSATPIYQIGIGSLLDGGNARIKLLALQMFNSVYNIFYISKGALLAISEIVFRRKVK